MIAFEIKTSLNDGMGEAPSMVVNTRSMDELISIVREEMTDDNGGLLPSGATLTIKVL